MYIRGTSYGLAGGAGPLALGVITGCLSRQMGWKQNINCNGMTSYQVNRMAIKMGRGPKNRKTSTLQHRFPYNAGHWIPYNIEHAITGNTLQHRLPQPFISN